MMNIIIIQLLKIHFFKSLLLPLYKSSGLKIDMELHWGLKNKASIFSLQAEILRVLLFTGSHNGVGMDGKS